MVDPRNSLLFTPDIFYYPDPTAMAENEIEILARKIQQTKLTGLAQFMIEAHRPLAGIFHSLAIAGVPFAAPFGAAKFMESVAKLFESQAAVDQFLQLLDTEQES